MGRNVRQACGAHVDGDLFFFTFIPKEFVCMMHQTH